MRNSGQRESSSRDGGGNAPAVLQARDGRIPQLALEKGLGVTILKVVF